MMRALPGDSPRAGIALTAAAVAVATMLLCMQLLVGRLGVAAPSSPALPHASVLMPATPAPRIAPARATVVRPEARPRPVAVAVRAAAPVHHRRAVHHAAVPRRAVRATPRAVTSAPRSVAAPAPAPASVPVARVVVGHVPPGQAKKAATRGTAPPAPHVPPGQAKKAAAAAAAATPAPVPPAPKVPPGQAKKT